MAAGENRISEGVLTLMLDDEVWIALPNDIVSGGDWLRLDRDAVSSLYYTFESWLRVGSGE